MNRNIRALFAFCILPLALLAFLDSLRAQQYNLQLLLPPSMDVTRRNTRDISGGYFNIAGDRVNAGALDVNTVFGHPVSSSAYQTGAIGTALLGVVGPGRLSFGGLKKDVSAVTIHGCGTDFRFYGGGELPRVMRMTSVLASFGSFTVGNNNKEELTLYNFLLGLQEGLAVNVRRGDWIATPSVQLGMMTGYREKYRGGTYYSNLNSGWLDPFPVLTAAADLMYAPRQLKLSAMWQRTFSSGAGRAMDTVGFQLAFGWENWGKKKEK